MSLITQTVTQATTATISPNVISDAFTTVTFHISTTLIATFGQTFTIEPPPGPASPEPTSKYTPIPAAPETSTVTQTEIDIYLQNAQGGVFSTWVIPLPASQSTIGNPGAPNSLLYVVQPRSGGWDSWSQGSQAGLIVGVVLGSLLLLAILFWCCRMHKSLWFVHGWPWSGHVHAAPPPTPGPSIVQPTFVNGPLMPYTYPPHAHGYGFGPV